MVSIMADLCIVNSKYFVSAIIIYLLITNSVPSNSVPVKNVCSLEDCKIIAKNISLKMDEGIQPCDNFYQFVCGKYMKDHSATMTQLDFYDEMQSSTRAKFTSLLENYQPKKIIKPFQQIATLFKLCMDQNTLIEQGAEPLRDILNQLGGWPLLQGDQWNDANSDWITINTNLFKLGFPFDLFIKFSIIKSSANPKQRIISLDKPSIQYKLDRSSFQSVYRFYDDSVANAMKLGATKDNAERELQKSQQLLIDITNVVLNTEVRQRVMYLNELSTKWPSINWTQYFTGLLSPSSAASINANDMIIVNDIYIDEMAKLIINTPSRVLMNYALSRVVEESSVYIRYENIMHLPSSRKKLCLNIIGDHLPNILDAMFVLNYVEDHKRNDAMNMVADIKQQFIKIIEQSTWLDDKTKISAIGKLASMSTYIGYPDEWKTDKWLVKYNDLELDGKNFLRCMWSINRFKKSYQYRTGLKHIEDEKRQVQMDRMPYYLPFQNRIIISGGFLQFAFLNNNLPKYINYGKIGFLIGHEIIHSFDGVEELIKINKNMMESSKDKFLGESTCLINQYNNYNIKEINSKLNGAHGLQENMADSSGIKLAYLAYTDWVTRNGADLTLHNLNFTPTQMFWINMANLWCTKPHPDILKDFVHDKHSPAEFRVIGAISNNGNFSKDFNCPVGSKMNPGNKCSVW